jgi:TolB-like protein/tetratricopeptide (TPR) repeat protein
MPETKHQLAAIMFTDIQGYTTLMQEDEERAVQIRTEHRNIFNSITQKYGGEILQYYGDGTLSIFGSAINAVRCGIEMQLDFSIPVRIGIHTGDIIHTKEEIIGDGVNIASRIESLAVAGAIFISGKVYDDIKNQKSINTKLIGSFELKNIKDSIDIYAITNDGIVVPSRNQIKGNVSKSTDKPTDNPDFLKSIRRKYALPGVLTIILLSFAIFYYMKAGVGRFGGDEAMDKSIAVLPLVNMSNDPDQEYFSDGLTEDILTQLSKIGELRVVSRTSIMKYKNTTKSIPEIGVELGVTHILEGSVRKYGNKVRISVQLIEATTDTHIWAEDFDRELKDIFAIQRDVSLEVASVLKVKLTSVEKERFVNVPTLNTKAYDKYLQGKKIIRKGAGASSEDLDQALRLFQEAISMDSNFSLAYVGIANTYLSFVNFGRYSSKEGLPKAMEAALKALAIDDEIGECYASLGAIYFYLNDLETAEKYLNKAIDITPSYDMSYNWLGWLKLLDGKLEQAVTFFEKAHELDPLSSSYKVQIALGYYWYREYDKSLEVLSKVLTADPENNFALWQQANTFKAQGKYEEAIETFHKRSVGTNTNWILGYTYGKAGNREEALRILNYQLKKRETDYVPSYMIAVIYVGLGDKEKALDWLEKAYEDGYGIAFIFNMKFGHTLDELRDEPRFINLLNKLGFKSVN